MLGFCECVVCSSVVDLFYFTCSMIWSSLDVLYIFLLDSFLNKLAVSDAMYDLDLLALPTGLSICS